MQVLQKLLCQRLLTSTLTKFCYNQFNNQSFSGILKDGQAQKKAGNDQITNKPIYMDLQATTPLDFRVLDAMLPYMTEQFGNPHSRTHEFGWETEKAVQNARAQIASLIRADPSEIIFTSGATESNNLALKGLANFYNKKNQKNHIITSQIEHKCILDTCRLLQEQQGFEITYLPVNTNGLVDLETIKKNIKQNTLCVSIMYVNNEIGVKQDIKSIGKICRERKVFLHTDAAQALGKIPIDVNDMNIDVMSITAHKIYGPKGIGALYVRRQPRVRILAQINGGGQERGLRSGTLPAPLCVGFGAACEVAKLEMENDIQHVRKLQQRLINGLNKRISHIKINGDLHQRYEGNLNVSFQYVEGESLLMALKTCALSSGSACTSASLEPSYVLRALGLPEEISHTSLRIGFGRFTTEQEVDYLLNQLEESVSRLRSMSPLWEMVQEGMDLSKIDWSQPK